MSIFDKLFKKQTDHNAVSQKSMEPIIAAQALPNGKIRHIVCLCYDAPYINSLKPQMQDFILKAEQERGSVIMPTSRITFDSYYDNASLENPDMIRQKLEQVYCQVYRQNAMYELTDKTVAREVQQKDGHTLVKYFVLYEENCQAGSNAPTSLNMPATIKIIRDSSVVAAAAPTIISVNGRQAAMITNNGGSSVIRADTSPISLQTNAVGKGTRYELEVPSGGYGEIHVKANVFQPKLTVWR